MTHTQTWIHKLGHSTKRTQCLALARSRAYARAREQNRHTHTRTQSSSRHRISRSELMMTPLTLTPVRVRVRVRVGVGVGVSVRERMCVRAHVGDACACAWCVCGAPPLPPSLSLSLPLPLFLPPSLALFFCPPLSSAFFERVPAWTAFACAPLLGRGPDFPSQMLISRALLATHKSITARPRRKHRNSGETVQDRGGRVGGCLLRSCRSQRPRVAIGHLDEARHAPGGNEKKERKKQPLFTSNRSYTNCSQRA